MKKLRLGQIDLRDLHSSEIASTNGLSGANTNINTVSANVDSVSHGLSGANSSINLVQGNAVSFASYANSTFATVSGGDPRVDSVTDNLNTFGSYANTTFATDTNLNTVQDNVTTNATTITTNKSVLDTLGTYANTTFATDTNLNTVSSNVDTLDTSVTTNYLNKTTGTAQSVVADVTFQNDVTIEGDLTVTGNTTIVNQTTINTEDGLIHLANNNESSDTLDIGFLGHYYDGATSNHAGFYRDAGTKEFYIFNTYNDGNEDTVNVDPSDTTFTLANVNIKVAKANTVQTDILTANGISYPTVDGTEREGIITDANGNLSFGTVQRSRSIALPVKNDTVSTIAKSKAVYITGVSGNLPTIGLADSSNVSTMPALGLVEEDILSDAEGRVVLFGEIKGLDTTGYNPNETLYVSTSGNLSNTKPIGAGVSIQNLGKVTKVASSGIIEVMGAGRTNDIPNLDQYEVFIGDGDYYERRRLRSSDVLGVDGIESNLSSFATYANSTFATDTNLNTVQDNVDIVQGHVDSFATYSNTTFATKTLLNTVQGNATSFATYSNTTFATDTNLNIVQDNVATNASSISALDVELNSFATYANSTFSGGGGSGDASIVEGNLTSFATYANSTFGGGNTSSVRAASDYTGDGTTTAFALNTTLSNVFSTFVTIDGLVQSPERDYTISGTTLSFLTAPPNGAEIDFRKLSENVIADLGSFATANANLFTSNTHSMTVVSSNLLPTGNEEFSLGSPTYRWKDLFLSNNTLSLGSATIKADADGTVKFLDSNDNPVDVEIREVKSGDGVVANTHLVQGNLDSFASYANSTFSSGGGGGGGGLSWASASSNITMSANTGYFVDCSSQAITITLPSSPVIGTSIRVIDATGSSQDNTITIARNSSNIQGAADNMTVNQNRAAFMLVYYNTAQGWLLSEV